MNKALILILFLGLLHNVDIGDTANVSYVHATSTFRVEVCTLPSYCMCMCIYIYIYIYIYIELF
jgi:hypothetical protein